MKTSTIEKPTVAFVVQRFGTDVAGGAETHCRMIVEKMSSLWNIEVLTSCAREYIKRFENDYRPGIEDFDGFVVKRFIIDYLRSDDSVFSKLDLKVLKRAASRAEEMLWLKENIPGIWKKAFYMPNCKKIIKNGELISYAPNGELYEDIEFDGQFDAKCIMNEKNEILSESIYIDGKWLEVNNSGSNGQKRKIGYYDIASMEAFTLEGNEKVYFDFEFGKGWKKRSSENTN